MVDFYDDICYNWLYKGKGGQDGCKLPKIVETAD